MCDILQVKTGVIDVTNYEIAVDLWRKRNIQNDAELAEALNGHSIAFAYHSGKIENEKEQMAYKILHRVVSRCSKVISVTITDMKKRKSKSYMYVNGLKKLLCMEFKIDSDNNKWMINAVNKEVQNDEIRKILQV